MKNYGLDDYLSIIFSPEYSPLYLDDKILPQMEETISAVVPTYNRCPYEPNSKEGNKNPLSWCIESLLNQKGVSLKDIVIVNDYSTDYTAKMVEKLKKDCDHVGVKLTYVEHNSNKGSPISKNDGIKNAKGEFVFFADDDCTFTNYSLFGALRTYKKLKFERGINVGAVHIPIYVRTTKPIRLIEISEIGQIDLKTGKATSNLKEFPLEYIENPPYIDPELKILEPIELQNLGGVFLSPRKKLLAVGGYPEYFNWTNGFTEEAELSLRLLEYGVRLFHSPDPKFHTTHFKFGAEGNLEFAKQKMFSCPNELNVKQISLEEMIKESSKLRRNTGNRINPGPWFYAKITSYAVLLGKRNESAARRWAEHTYEQFVEKNNPEFSKSIGVFIESKQKRKMIWESAIENAQKLCTKLKIKERYKNKNHLPIVDGVFAASLF